MTDISNFPFPSSLQNTETRYFVLVCLVIGHASTTSASAQAVAIICWTHLFFLFCLNSFSIVSFFPITNDVFTSVIINQVLLVLFFVMNDNLWL